jgi:hypothetical protein
MGFLFQILQQQGDDRGFLVPGDEISVKEVDRTDDFPESLQVPLPREVHVLFDSREADGFFDTLDVRKGPGQGLDFLKGFFLQDVLCLGYNEDDFFTTEIFFKGFIGLCFRQVLDGQVVDGGLKLKPGDEKPEDESDEKEKEDNGKRAFDDKSKP